MDSMPTPVHVIGSAMIVSIIIQYLKRWIPALNDKIPAVIITTIGSFAATAGIKMALDDPFSMDTFMTHGIHLSLSVPPLPNLIANIYDWATHVAVQYMVAHGVYYGGLGLPGVKDMIAAPKQDKDKGVDSNQLPLSFKSNA